MGGVVGAICATWHEVDRWESLEGDALEERGERDDF